MSNKRVSKTSSPRKKKKSTTQTISKKNNSLLSAKEIRERVVNRFYKPNTSMFKKKRNYFIMSGRIGSNPYTTDARIKNIFPEFISTMEKVFEPNFVWNEAFKQGYAVDKVKLTPMQVVNHYIDDGQTKQLIAKTSGASTLYFYKDPRYNKLVLVEEDYKGRLIFK